MASKFAWHPLLRLTQAVLAWAVLGLAAYLMCFRTSDGTAIFTFVNSIWTACFAISYLGMAPIFSSKIEPSFIMPGIELITMILWLIEFIAQALSLRHLDECSFNICKVTLAVIILGAIEWSLFLVTTSIAIIRLRQTVPLRDP